MGHFLVSRCALYLFGPKGLALAHERGIPGERKARRSHPRTLAARSRGRSSRRRWPTCRGTPAAPPGESAAGPRRAPGLGRPVEGVLAIGERSSGLPFSAEERDFARTLGLQALAALENTRLLRLREEKLRQDRELQVAREIQRGLFPPSPPELTGFEVAAESRPCYEVGGDAYDWVPLGGKRLALVVADVSGKGTPPAS